ncbi:hypothetical protein AB0E69_09085 [Kribbella sp. NPDC026611]|uniref:hypothetical protein n=1 Tax=Kribbella sp. NPDC026611 TaxID=3154911 RepID=UPI0033C8B186
MLASGIGAYLLLASPTRRQGVADGIGPVVGRLNANIKLGNLAHRALMDGRLVFTPDPSRLELRVASYLVRHPDASMRAIGDALHLSTTARRQLARVLRSHPSFELVSRYGWSIGRIRTALATEPSTSWQPQSA